MAAWCGHWGCWCFCVQEREVWVWTEKKWHSWCLKQIETASQKERRSVGRERRQSSCRGVPGAGCTLQREVTGKGELSSRKKRVWVEPGRTGEQQKVARANKFREPFLLAALGGYLKFASRRSPGHWVPATAEAASWSTQACSCCSRLLVCSLIFLMLNEPYCVEEGIAAAWLWVLCRDHFFSKIFKTAWFWSEQYWKSVAATLIWTACWVRLLWFSWIETSLQDLVGPRGLAWRSGKTAWKDNNIENEQRWKLGPVNKVTQNSHRWSLCIPSLKISWVNAVNNWGFDNSFVFILLLDTEYDCDTVTRLSPAQVTQMSNAWCEQRLFSLTKKGGKSLRMDVCFCLCGAYTLSNVYPFILWCIILFYAWDVSDVM